MRHEAATGEPAFDDPEADELDDPGSDEPSAESDEPCEDSDGPSLRTPSGGRV